MNKKLKSPLRRDPARNKKFKVAGQFLIVIILIVILILPYFVFAQTLKDNLKALGTEAGYDSAATDETTISQIAGTAVSAFLSLLGIIFIILIIYAGQKWMTAAGNEEKVTQAKETLWRSVIGLVIVVGAFAIWTFVYNAIF
jgi:TRAP-type C4-dicarboxylate transport system permease small subunit